MSVYFESPIGNEEFIKMFNELFGSFKDIFGNDVYTTIIGDNKKKVEKDVDEEKPKSEDDVGKHIKIRDDDANTCPYVTVKRVNEEISENDGDDTDEEDSRNNNKKKEPTSILDLIRDKNFCKHFCESKNKNDEPEDRDVYEDEDSVKNPFVFIANKLTFLIKTRYPIIWDTSRIATVGEDGIFVAFDKKKNPQIGVREAVSIANGVNNDIEINEEVEKYFKGTEWSGISCIPSVHDFNGENAFGFLFTIDSND